ncbi:MAG: MFS transporter [Deltaproteobacteria bacterium]|nr:MFS transporter [Deltaproteobacteria bacterium]
MVLNRRTVTAGLLIGVFLSSIDSTVVTTAMPSVIGELHGVALYGWVISAYLFAFTVATPIAGRLGDSLGRRPVYLFGAGGFMVASALSGLSTSIEMLIAFRALQGIAGGTLFAMTATLLGDLYPLEERGKVQALSSAVWGVSSIMGPLVGGLFVQINAWRWIFFLNLPFGALSIAIFMKSYRDHERTRARTDWVGAALFSGTVLAALFALPHANGASVTWAWREAGMLVLAAILGVGFVLNMRRGHPSPFIPFRLFRSRVVAVASLSGALAAGVMYSALTFLPLFVQGGMGEPAMVAGMVITPMAIGWPGGAAIASRFILRVGYRPVIVVGTTLLTIAMITFAFMTRTTPVFVPVIGMLFLGVGLGFSVTPFMVAVQSAVGFSERATVTAVSTFSRSLGGTFIVTILSTWMAFTLARELSGVAGGVDVANKLLSPLERRALAPDVLAPLQSAVEASLKPVFIGMIAVALLAFASALLFPRGKAREVTPEIVESAPVAAANPKA